MKTIRDGTCLDCGNAAHECECDSRVWKSASRNITRFIDTMKTPLDALRCFNCLNDHDTYMVKNQVWNSAWPSYHECKHELKKLAKLHGLLNEPRACLCIPCLETHLKRKLTIDDFPLVRANEGIFFGYKLGVALREANKKLV